MRAILAAAASIALASAILWPATPPRVLQLPAGIVKVTSPMRIEAGTEVRGARSGTTLQAAPGFTAAALIEVHGDGVRLADFTIDGNREANEIRTGLPGSATPFAQFTRGNGILAEGGTGLVIHNVTFRNIAGFSVLVSKSHDITIDGVSISQSGSRNPAGHNNTTGGILIEEGSSDFRVTRSDFRSIRGNALWTHSLYTSPRNLRGLFASNHFENIGRDAIQVGHAIGVRVEENSGVRIGFPVEDVDMESVAIPVGIDTAGNVEQSSYAANHFEEINGKCIDLDGFHDGEVRANTCINRLPPRQYPYGNDGIVMNNSNPDMQSRNVRIVENRVEGPLFGGIFVIGTGNLIARNRLLNLNTAHCNEDAAKFGCYYAAGEPDMLRSGIYLGRGAARPAPAKGNTVEDNEISGFQMKSRCIASAPGVPVSWNTIRRNLCRD